MNRASCNNVLDEPVLHHAKTDFVAIGAHRTVQEALDSIRSQGGGSTYAYFYVVDPEDRLIGVIQTRRLLTSPLDGLVASLGCN